MNTKCSLHPDIRTMKMSSYFSWRDWKTLFHFGFNNESSSKAYRLAEDLSMYYNKIKKTHTSYSLSLSLPFSVVELMLREDSSVIMKELCVVEHWEIYEDVLKKHIDELFSFKPTKT